MAETKRWQGAVAADELDTPLVVVHRERLVQNIAEMARFANEQGVALRPHLKTHKTLEIARLQMEHGAIGLTCAKLGEAEVFLANGFKNILIAYPLVGKRKLVRLLELMIQYPDAEIQTLVDDLEQALALSKLLSERQEMRQGSLQAHSDSLQVPLWIKIDSGLHRCGVEPGERAAELVREVAHLPGVRFLGLLTHAGHAYGASGYEQVKEIGEGEARCLLETAQLVQSHGLDVPAISVGSTPTVRVSGAVKGVTEIRPGNYVFCDATQVRLGVITPDRCALRVFTRVVSRPAPDRLVIDAGAKTLALDKGAHGSDAVSGYGLVVGHPQAVIERLSEEHGVVRVPADSPIRIGDVLEIIPNHSCPVANLTDELFVLDDQGTTERWQVAARGKTR